MQLEGAGEPTGLSIQVWRDRYSLVAPYYSGIVQLVEHQILILSVGGSNPSSGSNQGDMMKERLNVLKQPLVPYGGLVTESGEGITYYGHENYMPGWTPTLETSLAYIKQFDKDKLYLIHGDLSNPYFSWPMYAVKN